MYPRSAIVLSVRGYHSPRMTPDLGLLVFSDLDGTLIDHETYCWLAAREALEALRDNGCGLVLASSKTAAEISTLRRELDFDEWPAIVENGAGLLDARADADQDTKRYWELRAVLDQTPAKLRTQFCGFGDMTVAAVSTATGLPENDARLAKQRAFSEPGLWTGSKSELDAFLVELSALGIKAQQGGRFLTLSFGGNKADRVRELRQHYAPRYTVALGDAPNDIQMIESADFGVVVANPNRPPLGPLNGEDKGRIVRTQSSGPTGWNLAILNLLGTLELKRN